ncbi:MAG: hypothetical protein FWE21_04425 [Defluviitaleaceae bacterium]|nr:hypothetical protein [Defluviitaleaceae bacterium]
MTMARLKRAGQKITAAFLAFLMVFGYMTVFEGLWVRAATGNLLSASFTGGLTPAGFIIDPSPNLTSVPLPDGMVHLQFPISYIAGAPVAENTFTLQFPMGNTIRTFEIVLTSETTAQVFYAGGAVTPFFVNRGVNPGSPANANFVQIGSDAIEENYPVYPDDHINAGTIMAGFFPGRHYLDPYTPNPHVYIYLGTPTTPQFGIEQGTGFSFAPVGGAAPNMNQANAVSFLWDGADFHVVTGGMQQGRIYDFVLSTNNAATAADVSTQVAFTGFLYESRPVARHREEPRDLPSTAPWYTMADDLLFGRDPWGIEDPPVPNDEAFPNGWTNWDLPPFTTIPGGTPHPLNDPNNRLRHDNPVGHADNDWYPGGFMPHVAGGSEPATDNMLEFIILTPQRAEPAGPNGTFSAAQVASSSVFEIIDPDDAADWFEQTSFHFRVADPTGLEFTFDINDIFGTDPLVGQPNNGRITISPVENFPDEDRIGILLDGANPFSLPASRIFTQSTMLLGGQLPSVVDISRVTQAMPMHLRGLHTFLNYNVVFIDGQFHVRIEPFVGVPGRYRLDFHIPPPYPQAGAFVRAEGNEIAVFIPLLLAPDNQMIFNVVFEPDLIGVEDVPSQWMHFRATPDRMIMTAPGNFTITPNHPELGYILDDEGYARFEIAASWDMGMVGTMRDYFNLKFGPIDDLINTGEYGEITFTYHIRSRDYPDQSDDVTSIVMVEVIFVRHPDGSLEWSFGDADFNPAFTEAGLALPDPPVANIIPPTASRYNQINISLPMEFVVSSDYPPLSFEGIYFLTNTLLSVSVEGEDPVQFNPTYLHESRHNNRSFLALSRPDMREFPPPYDLRVWTDGIDPETRLGGFFDMSFMVPWYEIDRYLNRSPFHNAGYDHTIMYRIFIGERGDAEGLASQTPQERTARIWPASGLIMPFNVAQRWSIFPIVNADFLMGAPGNGNGGGGNGNVTLPPRPSHPGDFDFSSLPIGTTLGSFNVAPTFLTMNLNDPANHTALNNAFRAHVGDILDMTDTDTFEDWLNGLDHILAGANLNDAWSIIVNGTAWDVSTMDTIWDDEDRFNATVDLWNGIKEGFDFRPFMFLRLPTPVISISDTGILTWEGGEPQHVDVFSSTTPGANTVWNTPASTRSTSVDLNAIGLLPGEHQVNIQFFHPVGGPPFYSERSNSITFTVTRWISNPSNLHFARGTFHSMKTIGDLDVFDSLRSGIRDAFDPAEISNLNAAFVTHLAAELGVATTATFLEWLEGTGGLETNLTPAHQEIAMWHVINNPLWDSSVAPFWVDEAAFVSVVAQWRAALTGFEFMNASGLTAPLAASAGGARVSGRTAVGYGEHEMLVNSLPQPWDTATATQGVFDLSPWIEEFRAGPVVIEVPFDPPIGTPADFEQIFRFEGLDFNWSYYIMVDSWIEFWEYDADGNRVRVHAELVNPASREYSNNTDIQGVTTYNPLPDLDPGEIVPPAPQDLQVDEVTLNSGTISWLDIPPLAEAGRIEFEIVRFNGIQALADNLLNRRDQTMAQFVDSLQEASRAGFEAGVRTDREDGTMSLIIPEGMTGGDPNNYFGLNMPGGGRLQLENTGLTPNTLYFYYVRTVWITDSGETFSSWVGVSLTTTIVEPPINLRVVDHRAFPARNINPQTQFVIRFDAPVGGLVGEGSSVAGDHGTVFDFRFSLRSGTGQWQAPVMLPSNMGAVLIERHPTPDMPGYYTFTYIISGRSPGTTYQIRVHTFDVVNSALGDPFGEAYSEWSNIVTTRTDVDQDYMDRERDRENLRRYLRDLLREFLRQPYWTAMNQNGHFIGLYRPTMVDYLLGENGQMIRLADSVHPTSTFYLPQALFLAIWDGGQGFTIQRNDMTVTIPNQAINNINTEPVLDTVRRLRDVRGVEDYYIRLVLDVRAHGVAQIQGEQVAGQQVILSMDLVESNTNIRQLDENLMRTLHYAIETDHFIDRVIGDRSFTFGQEIENMVANGIAHLYQVRRLHEISEVIKHEMSAYVNTRLRATYGRAVSFNFISQPVSITLNNAAASDIVSGFQFASGGWTRRDAELTGAGRAIRTSVPGSFAFTRRLLAMPGLNTIQGHDRLTALIARHNLGEFFGAGDNFNINAPISLNAVQGTVARIGGAPSGANAQNWLRQQGYIVPVRGVASPVQVQEAVYMLMALYEMRTGTDVSALRITNFNALNGINGIDSRYRPYIHAAVQLNIFNAANMQPTANMTTAEFLRLLAVLDQRIGL